MISNSVIIRLLLGLLMWQATFTVAQAQTGYGRPNDRPTFSPYLNLLRRGRGGAAYNYFGIVRPQTQMFEQNQQFAQELQQLQYGAGADSEYQPGRGLPGRVQMGITGHPTVFMSFDGSDGGSGDTAPGFGGFGTGGLGAGYSGGFTESDSGFGTGRFNSGGISVGPGGDGFTPGFGGTTGHSATFGVGAGASFGADSSFGLGEN